MIHIQSCSFCRERSEQTSFTVNENQSDAQSVSWLVLLSILVSTARWTKFMKQTTIFLRSEYLWIFKEFKHKLSEVEVFLFKDNVCIRFWTRTQSSCESWVCFSSLTMRLFNRRLSLGTDVPISSNQQSLNHYSRWVQTFNAPSCTWFPAERFPAAYAARDAPLNLPKN